MNFEFFFEDENLGKKEENGFEEKEKQFEESYHESKDEKQRRCMYNCIFIFSFPKKLLSPNRNSHMSKYT